MEISKEELEQITGFIAESLEIIDGEWGAQRCYDQMASEGVPQPWIIDFMDKHKEHRPWTQTQENQKIEEAAKDKRLEEDGVIEAEIE